MMHGPTNIKFAATQVLKNNPLYYGVRTFIPSFR